MPASVSQVRAWLLTDSHDVPLPTPQPIDLATDTIPYGSRVRFEVEVDSPEPIYPLSAGVTTTGVARGLIFHLPQIGPHLFAGEVRLPWGLVWGKQIEEISAPPRFPQAGWPELGGGQYVLHIRPWPRTVGWEGESTLPSFDTPFQLGNPPTGGAAPRIVNLTSGLADSNVLVGQPWRPTAQVTDPDNDLLLVVFSVYTGGLARAWFLFNDGRYGSDVSSDIFSLLRVGGDWWDRPDLGAAEDLPATFSVQAMDLAGNWSAPAEFSYQIRYSQQPLWAQAPSPGAPNIVEFTADANSAPPACFALSARSDNPNAWVCGVARRNQPQLFPLYDDGFWPDATAGDGVFSQLFWLPFQWESCAEELICYAVPTSGPLAVGQRKVVSCSHLG